MAKITLAAVMTELKKLSVTVDTRFDLVKEDLQGMNERLDRMDGRLDGMDGRLDRMDARFDGIDARLDGIDARLDRMDNRFDRMEKKLDATYLQTGKTTEEVLSLKNRIDRLEGPAA